MQKIKKQLSEKQKKLEKDKFIDQLVSEVENDFITRQQQRSFLERQWELNLNFLTGNQYAKINSRGEIDTVDSDYFWQEKEVFNHIAPIIETRLSKLSRISPSICVRPVSDDDKDISGAICSEKLLQQAFKQTNLQQVVKNATMWSETCGTAFYKVVWDNFGGDVIGQLDDKPVYNGCVKVLSISPFEIFPDSLYVQDIEDCSSVIHARAMTVSDIFSKYNVQLVGENVGVFNLTGVNNNLSKTNGIKNTLSDACIVIERYEKPNADFPNGRIITVAGGKLLYYGELPYFNGTNRQRIFPFIKQECVQTPGAFFGTSIIDRLIPIQKAYNAVKNRKHEFLNRLSLGVLTVEDGSVDVDDLANGGLAPGKIVVYRQGSCQPNFLNETAMPTEFSNEEDKLLKEFTTISGVSVVSSSEKNATLSGASALTILIEQDNERLVTFAEKIRKCYVDIAKHIIRLYAQFVTSYCSIKTTDCSGKTKIVYTDQNAFRSDDVYLENDNELLQSQSQKNEIIFKLYESGIFTDKDGLVDDDIKSKILSVLGYKDLDNKKGIFRLQEERAQTENQTLRKENVDVQKFDDHKIHVFEHTRYVLGEFDQLDKLQIQRYEQHIQLHKQLIDNIKI